MASSYTLIKPKMSMHLQEDYENDSTILVVQVPVEVTTPELSRVRVTSADRPAVTFTKQPDRGDAMERIDQLELEVEMLMARLEKLELAPISTAASETYQAGWADPRGLMKSMELQRDMNQVNQNLKQNIFHTNSNPIAAAVELAAMSSNILTKETDPAHFAQIIPLPPKVTVMDTAKEKLKRFKPWIKS